METEYEVLQTFDTSDPDIVVDLVVRLDVVDQVKASEVPMTTVTTLRVRPS